MKPTMKEKMNLKYRTYIDDVNTSSLHFHHAVDGDRVAELVARLKAGDLATTSQPLPVVVESDGNGALVLRSAEYLDACQEAGIQTVEARVVPRAEFEQLIAREFAGEIPDRLGDIIDYIDGEAVTQPPTKKGGK